MKKIIKTLLVAMVLVLALTALVGCEDKPVETTPVVYEGHEGHNVAKIDAVEATCSKAGLTEGAYCVDCREMIVVQETIEKIEHVWVANEDRAFTCTLDGYKGGMHCEICGIQDGNTVITKAHCVYEGAESYVYTEATCVKAGILAHNCTVCGKAAVVEEIPATGEHSFTVDVEAKANTCGADGYTAHKACEVCGAKNDEYEVLAATGEHSFTVDVEAKAATCLDGYTAHKECDVCGAKNDEYEVIPGDDENGHEFDEEELFYYPSAPTCTEGAYIAGYCVHCGEGFILDEAPAAHKDADGDNKCDVCEEEIPVAHEHEWSDATCVAPKTCATCGETEGEALGHTWADATCTAPKTCSTCNETDGEALGHDYDRSVTAPTCTEAGYTTFSCGICDHTYTGEEVEALGHDLVDVEGKDATCGAAGYTAYKDCSRCTYVEGKETIPATGEHADTNEDYKCDVCATKMLPADGTALTIPQALAIAKLAGTSYTTQKYYITGTIKNVYNTQYGNMYIVDEDGNELCIYGLYTWDKAVRYDAMSYKPVAGDEVTVYTVLGMYNTTCQGKDAWLDEVVAHEHDYKSVVTEPGCLTEGYTTDTCSICGTSNVHSTVEALGHTTDAGECERCGQTIGGDAPVVGTLAEFTFGANGTASHADPSSKFSNGTSYTVNGYTLKFTSATNCYDGGRDAKGNSCMKMGTSSAVGSFTVTVPDNVTEVVIYVAQYKANTTKISVNGGAAQTITTASNNGAYTAIVIDTSVNKTFTFATVSGGVRCMIDTIVFNGTAQ